MSITIFTGAASDYKQRKVIERCHHNLQLDEPTARSCVFLFPQVSIAKEFSHCNADILTFSDSAYSFNRWVEKIWEQYGSSQAIVDEDKRETVLFECSTRYISSLHEKDDNSQDYILFSGIQSLLNDMISRFGARICDNRISVFLKGRVGNSVTEVLRLYFEELNKNHFIEKVDAIHFMESQELNINSAIVVDGFNDFPYSQLALLESLAIHNDVIISLNYVENNYLSSTLDNYISYFQNKLSPEIVSVSHQAEKSDYLAVWKDSIWKNSSSCHEEALRNKSIELSLAAGGHAEFVAVGDAILDALKVFSPRDIVVAIKNASDFSDGLRRYLEGLGVNLAYDLVVPLKSTVFGGALIDLLCMNEYVCSVISPTRDFEFQPAAQANAIFCSPVASFSSDEYYLSDVKLKKRFRDYKQACFIANQQHKESFRIEYSIYDEYSRAIKTKNPKDFKKLFDLCLANALAKPNITSLERREAALVHHAVIEQLSKSVSSSEGNNKKEDSVNLGLLVQRIYCLKLKFTRPQGTNEVLLTDAHRVRGRKIPCLIWAGLDNDNFNIKSENSISDDIEEYFGYLGDGSGGFTHVLTPAEKNNLLINEVIASAQKRMVLIAQCTNGRGEQKAPIPFIETIINNLDDREFFENEARGSKEDSLDRLEYLQKRGVKVFDVASEEVFRVQLSVGGNIKTPKDEPFLAILNPARGTWQLPLYENEQGSFEEHEFSPSSLEHFTQCPYRWFINNYVPSRSFEKGISDIEKGNYIHELLESFYKEWVNIHGTERVKLSNLPEARVIFDTILDSIKQKNMQDFTQSRNPFAQEFLDEAQKSAWSRIEADTRILGDSDSDTVFSPAQFEVRLGKGRVGDEDTTHNLQAHVEDVKILGSIDRVDENERGDYFVIDYKGSLGSYPRGNKWVEKCTLQAALYWLALENATGHPVAGAAYSSYAGNNEFNYLIDNDLINEDLVKASKRAQEIKVDAREVLAGIGAIASDSAHLMYDGHVRIAQGVSLNGSALKDGRGCKFCLFKNCPARTAIDNVGADE